MAQTFEDILNGLLSELAAHSNSDIDVLIAEYSKKLGVSDAGKKDIKTANQLLETIEENYQSLRIEKKENGETSTETWMREKLAQAAAEQGMNAEQQVALVKSVDKALTKQTEDYYLNANEA